jgi:anti-sigma B factor antagonist
VVDASIFRHTEDQDLTIETKLENGKAVLYLHGKVTIGVGDVKLRRAVHELVDQRVRHIVIDLENVSTIDSSGIGELVAAYTTVTNRGRNLELRNLPPKLRDILEITKLFSNLDSPDFPDFPDRFAY